MTDGAGRFGPPGAEVLRAFGASGPPVRLPGGRGLTWRAGDVVLRPHDGAAQTDWRSDVLDRLPHTADFRTPRPVRSAAGGWRAGEWEAWERVPGRADETRVEDVLRAGAAFHRAVAGFDRPAFLDAETDPWSCADRAVWDAEALPVDALPADATLDRLRAAFRPVRSPSQLVHGDLLGNVLFADGRPPTVIDWAPYWRPAGYGLAIAAVDAVCWHGVAVSRLDGLGADVDEWRQFLVRALAFRIATLVLLGTWDAAAIGRHAAVVDAVR